MKRFITYFCLICCLLISCENAPEVKETVDADTFDVILKSNGNETKVSLKSGTKYQIPEMKNDEHVLLSIEDSNGNSLREGAWITIASDTIISWNWSSEPYSPASDFQYEETANTVSITGYSGKGGNVIIPEKINNKPVVKISDNTMFENSSVISLTIPYSVKEISNMSIYGCSGIRTLIVDLRNTVYESEGNCIIDIAQKKLVLGCSASVIPAAGRVESIGSFAFANTNFNDFSIPEGVKTLDTCALANMKLMESVSLPSTLIRIGDTCFTGCTELRSVTIPASVSYVGNGPFQSCSTLSKIEVEAGNTNYHVSGNCLIDSSNVLVSGCSKSVIPLDESIVEIGNNAFCGIKISSLVLPETVKRIGNFAFSGCNLSELRIGEQVTEIGNYAFSMWTDEQKLIIAKTADKSRWNAEWYSECSATIEVEGQIEIGKVYGDFSFVDEEVGKISYMPYWPGVLKLANGETVKDTKRFYFSKQDGTPIHYIVYVPYTIVEFYRNHTLLCEIPTVDIVEGWYLKDKLDMGGSADSKFKAIGKITEMPEFDASTIKDKLVKKRTVTTTPSTYTDTFYTKYYMGEDIQLEDGNAIFYSKSAYIEVENNNLVLPIAILDEYEKAGFTNPTSGDPIWIYLHTYYPPKDGEQIWIERKPSEVKKALIDFGELKTPNYEDYIK